MAKSKITFVCTECGDSFPKWMGKCSSCGSFNTVTEYRVPSESSKSDRRRGVTAGLTSAGVKRLSDCATESVSRISSGLSEVDQVLGGGIVHGSMTLIGGAPGIGKSTLMLQIAASIAGRGDTKVLYVSGEESSQQIALRAERLGFSNVDISILTETSLELILDAVTSESPDFIIVDSIQTLFTDEITAAPGSVSQVRECTAILMGLAKKSGISLYIIGHVTKDGSIAGPRVLEHMVDTVLNFEGDSEHSYRILRGVKNRFGPSGEIALLGMESRGLVELKQAQRLFLYESSLGNPGSAVVPLLEGSRVLMVEVQALVAPSHFGMPQRVASGINPKKLALIIAVLEKSAGVQLGSCDIFVNVAGGFNAAEPAVDLAVAAALVSSFRNRPIRGRTSFMGELGLGGELRLVRDMDKRMKEIAAMGFEQVVTPPLSDRSTPGELRTVICKNIKEVVDILV